MLTAAVGLKRTFCSFTCPSYLQRPCIWRNQIRFRVKSISVMARSNYLILAWRIPWAEEPGGLQSTGLQRAEWLSHSAQLSHTCECVWFKSNIYILVFLKGEAHRRKAFFCRVRMHSPGGGSIKSLVSPESPGLGALGGITPVPEGQTTRLSPAGALQVRSWRCLLTPNQQGESRIYQQPQDTALRRRISDWIINFLSLLSKAALRLKPRIFPEYKSWMETIQ